MKKRQFLKQMGQAAIGLPLLSFGANDNYSIPTEGYEIDDDEAFWVRGRQDYFLKPN